jgi:hypothetical protein
MRKLFSIVIILSFSLSFYAQEVENALEQLIINDSNSYTVQKPIIPARKLKTGVDVNMGYMFSSAGYGGPQLSITPHVIYPLSDRFWMEAGIKAGYGQYMMPVSSSEGMDYKMLPMTQMFIYASGNYRVSEKLVVTGSAYRQVFDNAKYDRQAIISNYINNGISLGFNYKIGSNVSVGAQFHINSGNNCYPYPASGYNPYTGHSNPYVW